MGDHKRTQIGHTGECARKGCGKGPQYRVILGAWRVQAYVCTSHLGWAVNLDMITETRGNEMGWEHGYPVPSAGNTREIRPTKVIPEIGLTRRLDFGRDVVSQVATSFPVYRPGSNVPHFRPVMAE